MRGRGAGEVIAQLGIDGELPGDTGFGVLQDHVADVGQFHVARVEHFDAEHLVPGCDRAQRAHPSDRAKEVADDHGHAAAPFRPPQRVDGGGKVPTYTQGGTRRCGDGPEQCLLMLTAGPSRNANDVLAVGDHRPDPVAAATVEVGDRRGCRNGEVAFFTTGGAEVEAGGHIHHDPCLQLPVGDHLPDVRVGGSGGYRPVHPPDVIAGLVEARLAGLGTRTRDQAEVVALQHPVELAFDGELQRSQRRRELRVTDLTALKGGRVDRLRLTSRVNGWSGLAHRPPAPAGAGATGGTGGPCCGMAFTWGSPTVCRIRLITVSALTSSASAS